MEGLGDRFRADGDRRVDGLAYAALGAAGQELESRPAPAPVDDRGEIAPPSGQRHCSSRLRRCRELPRRRPAITGPRYRAVSRRYRGDIMPWWLALQAWRRKLHRPTALPRGPRYRAVAHGDIAAKGVSPSLSFPSLRQSVLAMSADSPV